MTDRSSSQCGGQRRADGAREHILSTAKALFALHGIGGVSINDIAREAGVSKSNVFYHFGSKPELHYEIVASIAGRARALLDRIASEDGTAAGDLRAFADGHLRDLLEDPDGSRMMIAEILSSGPEHIRALAEGFFEGNFTRLVELVRGHQEAGRLRGDIDPAFVATLLIAANVFFFMAQPLLLHFPDAAFAEHPDCYSDMLAGLLNDGLAPAKDQGHNA